MQRHQHVSRYLSLLRHAASMLKLTGGFLLLATILVGCTFPTELGYRQRVETWIGSTGEILVAQWGLPAAEHTSPDGSKIYAYRRVHTYTIGGGTKTEQVLVNGEYVDVSIPQPEETRHSYCNTTFYLSADDVIRSYAFDGDCTDYEMPQQSTTSQQSPTQPQPATKPDDSSSLCKLMDKSQPAFATDSVQLCGTPFH